MIPGILVAAILCFAPPATHPRPTVTPDSGALVDPAAWCDSQLTSEQIRTAAQAGGGRLGPFVLPGVGLVHAITSLVPSFAPDAEVVVMGAFPSWIDVPTIHCLAGEIEGHPGSALFVGSGACGVHGLVQMDGRLYSLSSGPRGFGQAVLATDAAALPPSNWSCGADRAAQPEHPADAAPTSQSLLDTSCRRMQVAIEGDSEFTAKWPGDPAAAAAYAGILNAGAAFIYQRDFNLVPMISYLRVWTVEDPWTKDHICDDDDQLSQFTDYWIQNMGHVSRASAHLLSGRWLGGGCAFVGWACHGGGYAVSQVDGYFPYPVVDHSWANWDLSVYTHEFGHNLNCWHTHNYTPPLDDCFVDGTVGPCTAASTGTIMSYCHICDGGESNLLMQFDPVGIARVKAFVASPDTGCFDVLAAPVAQPDQFTAEPSVATSLDVLANDFGVTCDASPMSINGLPPSGRSEHGVPLRVVARPGQRDVIEYGPYDPWNMPVSFDRFTYAATSESGSSEPVTVTVATVPGFRAQVGVTGDQPGILARYYDLAGMDPQALPDFTSLIRASVDVVQQLDYPATGGAFATSGLTDQVGAVFSAWLDVPVSDVWTLSLTSDDGSRLTIDGLPLIDNDGLHGMWESTGRVWLGAGKHDLRVEFFENGGAAGLELRWRRGSDSVSIIPAIHFTQSGENRQGNVRAWGAGETATGTSPHFGQSLVPADLAPCAFVSAGLFHTVALTQTGSPVCWGAGTLAGGTNGYGQCVVPASLPDCAGISAGGYHTAAIDLDGRVWCWGAGASPSFTSVPHCGQSIVPSDLGQCSRVSAGWYHTAAIQKSGQVRCWGAGSPAGGNLNFGQSIVPVTVTSAIQVSAGGYHTLSLAASGTPAAWGRNTSTQCTIPSGLNDVTAVAAGGQHSLALRANGSVQAWGAGKANTGGNEWGQSIVPPSLPPCSAIAAGANHSVALTTSGSVVAWGYSVYGQLDVPGDITTCLQVAAGGAHTVALVEAPTCPADLDGNAVVDFGDVAAVLLNFGACPDCLEDLDKSGVVDFGDIALVLLEAGPCPNP